MKNRILAVSNHGFMLGGGEHAFFDLLCHLTESWDLISTVPKNGDLTDKLRKTKIRTFVIPMPAIRPWLFANILVCIKSYLKICKTHHPQLIYANGSRAAIYGGVIGKILDIPVIWHCRIAESDLYVDYVLCKLCSLIIVNSKATANRFKPCVRHKIRMVYNGIDIDGLKKNSDCKLSNIKDEWKVILVVARASREKRHDLALSSFEKIAHLDQKIHIYFVGNRDQHEPKWWRHLQETTRRSRFSDRIHWIGHVEDIRPWYRAASILLLPSDNESFGRVLVEAMACGVPVVATRVGGVPEIVRHGKDGILVPMGKSQELANAIMRILKDNATRLKMGRSGETRAEEFNLESHIKAIIRTFKEAIGNEKTVMPKQPSICFKHSRE